MNWLARWYHRPEDYNMDRWLFLRNGYFVLTTLAVALGIMFVATNIADSKYFSPLCLGILAIAFAVNYVRGRNPKNVQWNKDWFRGKYSKWAIWWRG